MSWKRVHAGELRGPRRKVGERHCWLEGELVFVFVLFELKSGRHAVLAFERGRPQGFFECAGVESASDPRIGDLVEEFIARFEERKRYDDAGKDAGRARCNARVVRRGA